MIKSFFNQIRKLFDYLLGKTTEIGDLNVKDVLLAKVILDIHRKKTHSEFRMIPLSSIKRIHAIDRENSLESTRKRTESILKIKDLIFLNRCITRQILAEYLPSISWIKVVKENDCSFIAYEGNGRLMAMQNVFLPSDDIMVEVEEYHFKNSKNIIRRMNRVRRLNGLL